MANEQDEFERMAHFYDQLIPRDIENLRAALDNFAANRTYANYLRVQHGLSDITRNMQCRSAYHTHSDTSRVRNTNYA